VPSALRAYFFFIVESGEVCCPPQELIFFPLQKAEKCAVRLALKLEKAGFSESRLWHLLKDNQKGIQGFYDEMKTAVISSVIEVDKDARKPKVFFFSTTLSFSLLFQ